MKNIMVTGANGFVGSAILRRLSTEAEFARGTLRSSDGLQFAGVEYMVVGELDSDADWTTQPNYAYYE